MAAQVLAAEVSIKMAKRNAVEALRTPSPSLWRGLTVVALGLALGQTSRAQQVEQIGPSSAGTVGAITSAAGGAVAPIGSPVGAEKAGASAASLSYGTIESAMAGVVVERLRARTLTPEEAWKSGALDVDDLLYIVGERLGPWGGFFWERDDALRRALVKLLVEHGGERLKDTGKLPITVRLWMADYYGNIGDERVLALVESVIADLKPGAVGQEDVALQAVERLGWYWRDKGEYEKGAQAWERLPLMFKVQSWWSADAMVEAARMWKSAGQNEKAQALYAKVAPIGDDWLTGLASWDQARSLIGKGEHEKARAILMQHPLKSGQAQILKYSLLAYSYYRTGDFDKARQWAAQAINKHLGLKDEERKRDLDDAMYFAYSVFTWTEQWSKKILVCWPPAITVERGAATSSQINLRTFPQRDLSVKVDRPGVQVRLGDLWQETENGYCFDKSLSVQADAEGALQQITITVFDKNNPTIHDQFTVQVQPAGAHEGGEK